MTANSASGPSGVGGIKGADDRCHHNGDADGHKQPDAGGDKDLAEAGQQHDGGANSGKDEQQGKDVAGDQVLEHRPIRSGLDTFERKRSATISMNIKPRHPLPYPPAPIERTEACRGFFRLFQISAGAGLCPGPDRHTGLGRQVADKILWLFLTLVFGNITAQTDLIITGGEII